MRRTTREAVEALKQAIDVQAKVRVAAMMNVVVHLAETGTLPEADERPHYAVRLLVSQGAGTDLDLGADPLRRAAALCATFPPDQVRVVQHTGLVRDTLRDRWEEGMRLGPTYVVLAVPGRAEAYLAAAGPYLPARGHVGRCDGPHFVRSLRFTLGETNCSCLFT